VSTTLKTAGLDTFSALYVSATANNAGLATGFWSDLDELKAVWQSERCFSPSMSPVAVAAAKSAWSDAIRRTL